MIFDKFNKLGLEPRCSPDSNYGYFIRSFFNPKLLRFYFYEFQVCFHITIGSAGFNSSLLCSNHPQGFIPWE